MHTLAAIQPEPELLFCLALTRRPVETKALCQVSGWDEQSVHAALVPLREAALLAHDPEQQHWAPRNETARERLAEMAAGMYRFEEGVLLGAFALLHAGKLLDGSERICAAMDTLVRDGSSAATLVCLDILLDALKGWKPARHADRENARYLELVRRALGVCLYMTKRRRPVLSLLATAFSLADRLGNKRDALKLRLMQICLQYMVGDVLPGDPHEALEETVSEIEMLGDEDILIGTAHGISLRHHMRGEFAKSIAHLRDNPSIGNDEAKYYGWIGLGVVAASACALGRFGNAIGAVRHALDTYTRMGLQFPNRRTRILAAEVLLKAGLPDAALEIAGDAIAACDPDTESRLAVIGRYIFASYHFQKGDLPASHAMLCEFFYLTEKFHLKQSFEWRHTYEMLWAYREHGLADIPGHALEKELDAALADRNPYVQGLALRVRARQSLKLKDGYRQALPAAEGSRLRFKRCETPVAYARSGLVLAACLREAGRAAEAEAVYAESCAVLKKYRQYDCPVDAPDRTDAAEESTACAALCAQSFTEIPDRLSFEARLQWHVDIMRDSLNVECTAIFAVEAPHAFTCLAVRDFSLSEGNELARTYAAQMSECLENDAALWRLCAHGACLCLPLTPAAGRTYIFFAHCAYLIPSIMEREPSYFEPLRRALEEELRLSFRLHAGIRAVQQEGDRRARLVTEHLKHSEGLYYGPSMQATLEAADKAALTSAAVLLLGETGVGKEELARRIHQHSGRGGPFIVVNLASVSEQLFESELFGHERGAFTGASQQKIGLVELADKGTLFIDEIGEIPPALQVKLLRVLQDKKFSRVGGTRLLASDFRLISATNQDLQAKIKENAFREDLLYRIAVVPLTIAPLRKRPDDIKRLAQLFHGQYCAYYRRAVPPLTQRELEALGACRWPGNIRQLKGFIERGVILYDSRKSPHFLQERLEDPLAKQQDPSPPEQSVQFRCDDLPTMLELQRRYIRHVLTLTRGKILGQSGALAILDMKQSSLYKKIKAYGLDKTSQIYGHKKD